MSLDQVQGEPTQAEVLSRMAELSQLPGPAGKFFPAQKMRDLYRRVRQSPNGFQLENLLSQMRIELRIDAADKCRIPATGPVVVIANHPFGMLDGAVLTVLLSRERPDVKVMTNFPLGDVPELQRHCIFVDSSDHESSSESNHRALRQALAWLQDGGMLAIFPAGDVSHLQFPAGQIVDPEWSNTAVRLIRRTGASALPMYFCGHNSVGFQLMDMIYPRMVHSRMIHSRMIDPGVIHSRLRTALLLQEFLQHEGKPVEVRVGSEIPAESIAAIGDDREATDYLRWRAYLLGRRTKAETFRSAAGSKLSLRSKLALHSKLAFNPQKPVASPIEAHYLQQELGALPANRCLAQNAEYGVYLVAADETPCLLQEVGRLREVTFRQAGEGTGNSRDLDRFDRYYWHMLLWHKTRGELVGGYRAGNTAEILAKHGVGGLYTSTLFHYDARLFEKIGPALELGRSFIRAEYQRQYAPLLLLWKGIARLVAMHPEIPVLFGAVSISNDYSAASREMIYRFFQSRIEDDELAGLIKPRSPFRPPLLRPWDCRAMCVALRDLEDLSQPIADVETDGKGLPILLRQYAKIGGKLLGFNVDRKFSNTLDGLIVVDLRQTEPAVLDRYMGREDAARFRQVHCR